MEKIQDTVTRLNKMRKKIQLHVLIFLALMVVVAIISFNYPLYGACGAVPLAIYYFGFFRKEVKKYQEEFIHQTLVHSVCKDCTDLVYDCNKKAQQALKDSPMLPVEEKSVVGLWNGFTANCRKHSMIVNEASCNFQIQSMKGKQIKCVTGTSICIDAPAMASVGTVIIYDRSVLYNHTYKITNRGNYELKDLPEGFDTERFIVFVPQDSVPQLDEHFMAKFNAFAAKIETPFIICLQNGQLQVMLCDRFYAQKVAVKYEVTERALLGNRLPELPAVVTFAD